MKINKMRVKAVLILFICCLSVSRAALANAGPVYMEGYPGFGIAAMEECPVRVEREELTFVIDEYSASNTSVEVNYTLRNTASEKIIVPMIFPIVSYRRGYSGAQIEFNGKAVDYEIYLAGHVDVKDYLEDPAAFNRQVDINTIIKNLNEPPYEPQFFDDKGDAVLYELTYKPPVERQSRISFTLDSEKTRAISFGFTGFGVNADGECHVSAYVREDDLEETAYLLVLGEDTLTDLWVDYNDKLVKSSVNVKDFLCTFLSNNYAYWNMEKRNRDNFYAAFIKEIDQSFSEFQPVFSASMTMDNLFNRNNISVVLYEVAFEANSQNELRLTYPMRATIDRRETGDYINTFAYILNPARNFMDFGGVDIRIELNENSPYIIESSLPLQESGKGIYVLSLDSLPDEDLVFSTYSKKEISFWDGAGTKVFKYGYGGLFVKSLTIILLFYIALKTVVVIVKKRNRHS
ncbi:MAG: hypothetical protein GXZ07_07685 [Firmicutes bacterium]|nr:hypothetical protein [Bacillota bacterium]